ncbi:MAG: restriction endonuclease subunit S [Gemmiger sp.]|nr:restriction endonuclease subunit S [Gemmiger sp.]
MDTGALRQKILDLAIRGKLVPQDPNDEPASVLLERIRAEKQQMVQDGKLKAKDIKGDTIIFKGEDNLHYEKFQDGSVKCIEEEIPFEVPEGWAWARINSVLLEFITGPFGSSLHKSDYVENGIPVINPISIIDETLVPNGKMTVSEETFARLSTFQIKCGDILVARRGDMGRCAVARKNAEGWLCGTGSFVLRKSSQISPDYLSSVIASSYSVDYLSGGSIGNTMLNLNQAQLKYMLVPIPPRCEQEQIVIGLAKSKKAVSDILVSRETLTNYISTLKSRILDLAIRGKLVPQDSSDEPASVLLEHIRAEKEELIKQGKIKRDKNDSIIYKGDDNSYYLKFAKRQECLSDQLLFDLPHGWRWCTLYEIARIDLGKTLDKAKNTGNLYPYLRSVNVRWNAVDLSDIKEMRFEEKELKRYAISKNDLLICEGGDVGRCCVWCKDISIQYQNALHRVKLFQNCNPYYFMYYLMCYESKAQLKRMCAGVTIKHLTGDVLSKIPFALPPISEQNRIVEAVDKAFVYLDQISASLS